MSIQTPPTSPQSTSIQPRPATLTAASVGGPSLGVAIARRIMPAVASSAATALATLAAERALAGFALRAVERTGLMRSTQPEFTRVIVMQTTIVERVARAR